MTTAIQNAEARLLRERLAALDIEVIRTRFHRGVLIAEIAPEGQARLLERWELGYPDVPGNFLTRYPPERTAPIDGDDDGLRPESFEVSEGWTGDHYVETFFSERAALRWFEPGYECIDECARIDRLWLMKHGFCELARRFYGGINRYDV